LFPDNICGRRYFMPVTVPGASNQNQPAQPDFNEQAWIDEQNKKAAAQVAKNEQEAANNRHATEAGATIATAINPIAGAVVGVVSGLIEIFAGDTASGASAIASGAAGGIKEAKKPDPVPQPNILAEAQANRKTPEGANGPVAIKAEPEGVDREKKGKGPASASTLMYNSDVLEDPSRLERQTKLA